MGSRRAEIFKKLVPHINSGRYFEWEGHFVFGSMTFEEFVERIASPPGRRNNSNIEEAFLKLVSEIVTHQGKEMVSDRVTLGVPPRLNLDALRELSGEERIRLSKFVEGYLPEVKAIVEQQGGRPDPAGEKDSIDAALTEEMLGKLPKAVERATKFDKMELERSIDPDVKRYFEEAHRCYLYGFNVACAVLCRALLEAALQTACDPSEKIKNSISREKSYFRELTDKAQREGLLTDDKPSSAIQVRKAGDAAIHNHQEFERRWLPKLGDLVDFTRKILIDLFESTP
jgi:hypothetical protein